MPVEHVNFYENLKEAHIRIRGTYVLYDKEPYHVLAVTNHKEGGVFRVYLNPINREPEDRGDRPDIDNYGPDNPVLGNYLDDWMAARPNTKILRKRMDSKHFEKFRPFPLGMCNAGRNAYYLERQPQRNREQGLTRPMISETIIAAAPRGTIPKVVGTTVQLSSKAFHACVKAQHPSAEECMTNLLDPDVENESVAFHRHFALVRGPIDMIFLAYKGDVVASVPGRDLSVCRIGRDFRQLREVIEELKIFGSVVQQ